MFKVEKTEFVNKTFRFPKDFYEELHIYASKNNISVNSLIIQCCKYALNNSIDMDNTSQNHK